MDGLLTLTGKNSMKKLMSFCCMVAIVGCDPVDDKDYLDITEKTQLGAYISLAVVTSTPEPDGGGGKLNVGDECPDCQGSGRLGDGTVEMKCDRCNGTGKVQKGDPDVAAVVNEFNETVMTNAEAIEAFASDTPKKCLCDPACPDCDGNCDPCNCLFCLPRKDPLPDPVPAPMEETVRRNGQLYRKEGNMLVPVEDIKDVRTKRIGEHTTSNSRPRRSVKDWGEIWYSPVAIGCS